VVNVTQDLSTLATAYPLLDERYAPPPHPPKMFSKITRTFVLAVASLSLVSATLKIPFLSQKKYTPLVFFTVPKDVVPDCDAVEKIVSQVEKELGVRVERLDVARDAAAEATLRVLTQRQPPFLYHRESCQTVYAPNIDKARVRAWAKGRIITAQSSSASSKAKAPIVVSQDDNAIDQKDLIEDATLSPMGLSGKEKMKERTEALGKEK